MLFEKKIPLKTYCGNVLYNKFKCIFSQIIDYYFMKILYVWNY